MLKGKLRCFLYRPHPGTRTLLFPSAQFVTILSIHSALSQICKILRCSQEVRTSSSCGGSRSSKEEDWTTNQFVGFCYGSFWKRRMYQDDVLVTVFCCFDKISDTILGEKTFSPIRQLLVASNTGEPLTTLYAYQGMLVIVVHRYCS